MLTLFAIPKAFDGDVGAIQRNAIRSWVRLGEGVEVMLLGDEAGVAEAADDFRVAHVPTIAVNGFGTPLLDSAFAVAEARAAHEVLMYANADLILFPELITAVKAVRARADRFMLVGRCYDLDVRGELDHSGIELLRLRDDGQFRGSKWIDYFVFPKHTLGPLPPFAVGRPWWDNWMIWRARKLRLALVDVTPTVLVVHQRHAYGHVKQAYGYRWKGPEGDANTSLLRFGQNLSIDDATHALTEAGIVRRRHDLRRRVRTELWLHNWGVPIYRAGRWLYGRLVTSARARDEAPR
jgi:hypothetical protein